MCLEERVGDLPADCGIECSAREQTGLETRVIVAPEGVRTRRVVGQMDHETNLAVARPQPVGMSVAKGGKPLCVRGGQSLDIGGGGSVRLEGIAPVGATVQRRQRSPLVRLAVEDLVDVIEAGRRSGLFARCRRGRG